MKHILGVLTLITLAAASRSNVIIIGGVETERTQFCVGEKVRLLCQNYTLGYEWKYPGGMIGVTSGANAIRSANGFTATYVNATTTTLDFVVSSDMNGITITCTNIFDAINISATNVEVLGISSMTCPGNISAVGMDNCPSVEVSLHSVSRCTREYSASISGGTKVISSVLNEANYDAEFLTIGSFNLANSSLGLCNTYNFSVNVTFFDNSSMTCPFIAVDELPTKSMSSVTCPGHISAVGMDNCTSVEVSVQATTMEPVSTMEQIYPKKTNVKIVVVVVVVVVVMVMVVVVVVIVIIMIGSIIFKKCTRSSKKLVPLINYPEHTCQDRTIAHVVVSQSNMEYAQVEKKKNKGFRKTRESNQSKEMPMDSINKDKDFEDNDMDSTNIKRVAIGPSDDVYTLVQKRDNRSKKKSIETPVNPINKDIDSDSKDPPKNPLQEPPVYAVVDKTKKGFKKDGKSGKVEERPIYSKVNKNHGFKKDSTQKQLVTRINVQSTSKSSPPS